VTTVKNSTSRRPGSSEPPTRSTLVQEDWPRNVDAYHGGQVADELAGLISLILGIRLESGGLTRIWNGR
jgi:hypothetical protein